MIRRPRRPRRRFGNVPPPDGPEDQRQARRMDYLFVGICVAFVIVVGAIVYFGAFHQSGISN